MFDRLRKAWQEEMTKVNQKSWMQRLQTGKFEVCHYKGFLLETYHHAGLNPQIQAFATMFFKKNPRDMIELFYKHATSEIGHDLLALGDLEAMGEERESLIATRPLPSTVALNAFVLMQIQFVSPLSYLGYLFHLEFLPTGQGEKHMAELARIGVPENAMGFLKEHATIDIGHNRLMQKYVTQMVTSTSDLEEVIYSARCTCQLHYNMLEGAFENGEVFFKNAQ
jgi:pyrroloquinoline quinone (PQQ) biosynthesis protein C